MGKYFSSDWHLSHEKVMKTSNRPFNSIKEMDEIIINNMISPLKKGDCFYFLGDISFDIKVIKDFFERFPKGIDFHWILGNHDEKILKQVLNNKITSISSIKDIKIMGIHTVLCHFPMLTWNKSHYNSIILFGHHHTNGHGDEKIKEKTVGKMLNVNCEFNNYNPYSETDIISIMKQKENNWDLIEDRNMFDALIKKNDL